MRLRKKHFAIPEMKELDFIYFDETNLIGNWNKDFKNDNDIHLEIGPGKGTFISTIAQQNPNKNYIIVEVETNALVYATRKIRDLDLKNIRVLPIDANKLESYLSKDEISRIYIHFPNPWPKNRHHKRRLTHPRFLNLYKKFLKKGGEIYFKTDDYPLFEESKEYFKECGYEAIYETNDMPEDFMDNIVTEYETKWRSQGIKINFGIYKLL